MAERKIPEQLIPFILQKAGESWGPAQIVDWLNSEHKISVTEQAVRKRLKKVQTDRVPIAQAIVAHKLSETLSTDLDKVGGIIDRALEDELRCRAKAWGKGWDCEKGEPVPLLDGEVACVVGSEMWQRLMISARGSRNDLAQALELRLKLAGADKDGKPKADPADVRKMLMDKIDSLMEKYLPKNQTPKGGAADSVTTSSVH